MIRRISYSSFFLLLLSLICIRPLIGWAANEGSENLSRAGQYIDQAVTNARQGNLSESQKLYQKFGDNWLQIEDSVKIESSKAYSELESSMGRVQFAFLQNNQQNIVKALQNLKDVKDKFVAGKYANQAFKKQNITLSDFIAMLQDTKETVKNHDQQSSLNKMSKIQESWLSIEGTVVAQSATVYSDTERDMVTVSALISAGNFNGAMETLNKMVSYLTPLASKSSYTMWDAAMIPIREGLEALLVVGSLLAFVKKSNVGKGKVWIWSGVTVGFIMSAILALIIKFVFTSGAFGQNNFLISGWTGIIAAVMLLYMSYWLHSKSNIAQWNMYIQKKSQSALDSGRIISLGILSFLAVFREGTETVLFIIGMVNQISMQELLLGIVVGLGILAVIAYLMLAIGVKLPIRSFFLVSSLIVFYLCLKFTGLGIHSFQLAGALPSNTSAYLPSIDFFGFYPSWQSAVPQLALLLFAIVILFWSQIKKKRMIQY